MKLNNDFIDFNEIEHRYFINGVELPSVTRLISCIFGNIYASVSSTILQSASAYGSKVHDEIDTHFKNNAQNSVFETNEARIFFEQIAKKHNIKYIASEEAIAISRNNKYIACGKFDLLCLYDDCLTLIDFKTTSTIHLQEVILQLNSYAIGLKQLLEDEFIKIDLKKIKLLVIQLKETKYNIKEIPVIDEEIVLNKLEIAKDIYEKETDRVLNEQARVLRSSDLY